MLSAYFFTDYEWNMRLIQTNLADCVALKVNGLITIYKFFQNLLKLSLISLEKFASKIKQNQRQNLKPNVIPI